MQIVNILYILLLSFGVIFSYAFVDQNFPLHASLITQLVSLDPTWKTILYIGYLVLLFGIYLTILTKLKTKQTTSRHVWVLIWLSSLLLFSYPAFSFDIFNYIATAKVTFLYGENPYIVMPIEFTREPLLAFMHAANKTALYGPAWILLTALPFFAGLNNLFLTIFTFKFFNVLFYLGASYLIFLLSKKDKTKLAFFALNPLVIIETLVSGHNDIVMVFFALLSYYLLNKKLYILSVVAIIISIFIKFATLFIAPIYLYTFLQIVKKKAVNWDQIWFYCFIGMLLIFLLSPFREEMYSWYFIWPFSFLTLLDNKYMLKSTAVALSLGLLLRFAPFIYTGGWGGITPIVKIWVTVGSALIGFALYPFIRKKYL